LTNDHGGLTSSAVRKLTTQPWTGAFTTLLSLLLVPLFAYANLLCVASGVACDVCEHQETDSDCAGTEAAHHDEVPAHPVKDFSKDSCFCVTMNTVVTQPTVTNPSHSSLRVVDFVFAQFADVMAVLTATVYDHGPPGIAPPDYLFSKTLSPRAPPLGA